MKVLTLGNKILTNKSIDVKIEKNDISEFDKQLSKNLLEFVKNPNNESLGLAAPQVGFNKRIFAVKINDKYKIFINPVIVSKSYKKDTTYESCLSIPGVFLPIKRNKTITVESYTYNVKYDTLKKLSFKLTEYDARVFQHEYDHLDGILITKRLRMK